MPSSDARPDSIDTGPPGPACRFSMQCGPNEICVDDHCILAEALPIEDLEFLPEIRRATAEELAMLPIAPIEGTVTRGSFTGYSFLGDSMRMAVARLTGVGEVLVYTIDDGGVTVQELAGQPSWVAPTPDEGVAYATTDAVVWLHPDGSRTQWDATTLTRPGFLDTCAYGGLAQQDGTVLCLSGTGTPGQAALHHLAADLTVTELRRVETSSEYGDGMVVVGPDGPEIVSIGGSLEEFTVLAHPVGGAPVELLRGNKLPGYVPRQDHPASWVMMSPLSRQFLVRETGLRPLPEGVAHCQPTSSRVARFWCERDDGGYDIAGDDLGAATAIPAGADDYLLPDSPCISRGGRRTIECFGGWAEIPLTRRSR